ncbi:threonylcarbamoyl-AMP synthase [Patescibacteria group bacterium]|nr:MAG: threonylcarbamoyl-AMP synthase [Patescibacteria group bacterium]
MRVLPLDKARRGASLAAAVRILKRGGVVVVPTETSYGLAADALNPRAVARVRRLKGRGDKPMALMASSASMVRSFFHVEALAGRLMRRHWPGPLTLVLPVRNRLLSRAKLSRDGAVGVRVPSAALPRLLSRALGRPIVATSANRSGAPAAPGLAAFLLQFRNKRLPDAFLDAGRLPVRLPSTVARIIDGGIRIVRSGSVMPRA